MYCGFCMVNVLIIGVGGVVYVNVQVGWVNFDIDIVFYFWVNECGVEGGMMVVVGIEWVFMYQMMNVGFCMQLVVGVIVNDFNGYGFNFCDFIFGFFDDFGFKVVCFCLVQVYVYQYVGLVLGFGVVGIGLNVKVVIGVVVFVGEYVVEFKLCQFFFQGIQFGDGFVKGFFVICFYGQIQQVGNVFQFLGYLIQGIYDGFQGRMFFIQCLGVFGFVLYVWLFQFGVYFFEMFFFGIVVKDIF